MSLSNKALLALSLAVYALGSAVAGIPVFAWLEDRPVPAIQWLLLVIDAAAVYASLWYIWHYRPR